MTVMKNHDDCLLRLMAQKVGFLDGSSRSTLTADVQTKCRMQALRLQLRKESTPCELHSCLFSHTYPTRSDTTGSRYQLKNNCQHLERSCSVREVVEKVHISWQIHMLFIG